MRASRALLPVISQILSGLSGYADYAIRAKCSEAVLACAEVRTQVVEFALNNGRLPTSMAELQMPPLAYKSKLLKSLELNPDATIVAKLQGEKEVEGMTLMMRPTLQHLGELPAEVMHVFGYALYLAQVGAKHGQAKPLRGFGSAGVLEVVEDWRGGTYRAVYTVRYARRVFVLHVFQKKSKAGIATPKPDLDLIWNRLKVAEQRSRELKDE